MRSYSHYCQVGKKNCWEGNKQENQCSRKHLKKSYLVTGTAYARAKKELIIPNNSARPLMYIKNLY